MPRAISCSAKLSPRHAKISWSPLRTALPGTRLATPPALTTASPSPAQAHLQPFGVLGMVAPARHHQARGPIPARPISPTQHDREVLVTACGRICMHRKPVNISTVLAGQRLVIEKVDNGIWIVSFISYDLGFSDLQRKTLQPSDNPLGPRMSPTS